MKRELFLLCFFLKLSIVNGQLTFLPNNISKSQEELPDGLHFVWQNRNDTLLNVREYNPRKQLIFKHYKQFVSNNWNGKYIIMIDAFIYNDFNELIKTYSLHSNAGFSSDSLVYNEAGFLSRKYRKNNWSNSSQNVNSNPYSYIAEIHSLKELISHEEIKSFELSQENYLSNQYFYADNGNLRLKYSFNKSGDTTSIWSYTYDNNNSLIYLTIKDTFLGYVESYYTYDNPNFYMEEQVDTSTWNLIQVLTIKRKSNLSLPTSIVDITYTYDDFGFIKTKTNISDGVFKSREEYVYNTQGKVIAKTSYLGNWNKKAFSITYSRNKEGYIIKSLENDIIANKVNSKQYQYTFKYY